MRYRVCFTGHYTVTIDAAPGVGPVDAQDAAARLALDTVRGALMAAGFRFDGGGVVSHDATPRASAKHVKSRVVQPAAPVPIIRIGEVKE